MADLNVAFGHVCQTFGIRELNAYQREVIVQFAQKKTVVFVNLPTGYGSHLFIKLYRLFTIQFLKLLVTICCCGFAACKSYERPGRQIGKYRNSCRFSQ